MSYVIYTGLIKLTDVNYKFHHLNKRTLKEKQEIKKELYLQTLERFKTLKKKHLTNIEFILPNKTIFLNMTSSSNEKLREVKSKALEKVKKTKKPIDSFIVNNKNTGFQFIYPIMVEDDFVGFLNITFSEQGLTSSLMKQYYVLSNFIIKEDSFSKEFLKYDSLYKEANFKGYLHNKNILKELEKISRKDIMEIKPKKEVSEKIYLKAMNQKINSTIIEKEDTIVTTIPIINTITQEQEAFLAILSKEKIISNLNYTYKLILVLVIFLLATTLFAIYFQIAKSLIQKDNLNKIIQKDKQLLEQMKLAQMGEMIGNIAHQWRQPLSTISTAASGLKMKHEFNMIEENDIPEYTDTIVNNAKYLSETIDTFRDFIKEDNEEKEIILQEKIDETIKIVKASLENHHIKLINNIDYSKPLKVKTIAEELAQVLINVINNAKDVLVEREIENASITLNLFEDKNNFSISIEDNAGGIEKEILPKIFDPYFTTKHQFHGTGLGLYMSKNIVEKHLNGYLEVSNTKNGAKFTINIKY
ncbi:hypothetical protein CP965_06440 [Halarcobacter mediterraneus]|uniref:histidine kinase n=1 Tax=Halarcobacter mediterraneus TaxID=2023153 RepID=A0A4Q1AVG7_9BACT|nr:HAMP domain-containing sensor histidine kinase [Halarcobacter mediterraneus]RXK13436.1 hypothetical protein CP965_06440 [Halarcobacter mediterraneus]